MADARASSGVTATESCAEWGSEVAAELQWTAREKRVASVVLPEGGPRHKESRNEHSARRSILRRLTGAASITSSGGASVSTTAALTATVPASASASPAAPDAVGATQERPGVVFAGAPLPGTTITCPLCTVKVLRSNKIRNPAVKSWIACQPSKAHDELVVFLDDPGARRFEMQDGVHELDGTKADITLVTQLALMWNRALGHASHESCSTFLFSPLQSIGRKGFAADIGIENGCVVGYVFWSGIDAIPVLRQLFVLQQYRRRSWARRLIQHRADSFRRFDAESPSSVVQRLLRGMYDAGKLVFV